MPGRKRKQVDEGSDVTNKQGSKEPTKMTVAELKKELQARGLDTSGKKAELVPRLEEALKGTDEADGGPSEVPPSAKKAKTDSTDGDKKDVPQKEEETEATTGYGEAVAKLKSGEKKQRVPKVDQMVPGSHGYTVVDDWDCMLNQTNIGQNNNKFYIIQMLLGAFQAYYVWTRWGRVGEPGQTAMKGPFRSMEEAAKEFKKKFTDKTKNKWEDRAQFTPVAGKYTLLEMDDDEDDAGGVIVKGDEPDAPPKMVRQCSLDKPTQELVRMIFDNDMFNNAMQKLELDTKKMPLGKLSKSQIAKGFEVLEEIEPLVAKSSGANRKKLQELSSRFYTIIPHDFGRRVPPVIDDEETLRKKFDMLLVLGDIEIAQTMKKDQEEASQQQDELEEVPHPLDINYETLQASLSHIPPSDKKHQLIQNYINATVEGAWRKPKLLELWEVDRKGEDKRFASHDHLVNRRLLWHGTNVAVVAAILKSGLRIMPHSGGLVGKGIYFASENSKSAAYVGTTNNNIGVMFLGEVALGRECHIDQINTSLKRAPDGYDSIVARGRTEPDPKDDTTIILDSKEVTVPQGKPIDMPKYSHSSFSQSEYLIYRESQCRLRYLLKMKFG